MTDKTPETFEAPSGAPGLCKKCQSPTTCRLVEKIEALKKNDPIAYHVLTKMVLNKYGQAIQILQALL